MGRKSCFSPLIGGSPPFRLYRGLMGVGFLALAGLALRLAMPASSRLKAVRSRSPMLMIGSPLVVPFRHEVGGVGGCVYVYCICLLYMGRGGVSNGLYGSWAGMGVV